MPFAFAQIFINHDLFAVLVPHKLVDVFCARLLLQLKPSEPGAGDQPVYILHRFCGINSLTVEPGDFRFQLRGLLAQPLLLIAFFLPCGTVVIGSLQPGPDFL